MGVDTRLLMAAVDAKSLGSFLYIFTQIYIRIYTYIHVYIRTCMTYIYMDIYVIHICIYIRLFTANLAFPLQEEMGVDTRLLMAAADANWTRNGFTHHPKPYILNPKP